MDLIKYALALGIILFFAGLYIGRDVRKMITAQQKEYYTNLEKENSKLKLLINKLTK